jgi:hypothetical protein
MSWLSSLFGGGDNSQAMINAAWQQYYDQQDKAKSDAAAAAQIAALQDLMKPSEADTRLANLQATQAEQDAATAAARRAAGNVVSGTFTPGFESTYLPSTAADPYEAQAYATQRGTAEDYLTNLLKRGVITETGYQGGESALEAQAPRVRQQLKDLGDTIIGQGRSALTDIGNQANQAAATYAGTGPFDITPYTTNLGSTAGEFTAGLSDKYLGQVPTGLFDTSSLASSAGAASGAQNTPFDRLALAGTNTGDTYDPNAPVTPKKPVSVF